MENNKALTRQEFNEIILKLIDFEMNWLMRDMEASVENE